MSLPVLVYRVYPDGREELVRGLRFRGLTVRSLRDILAAGGEPAVFDYLENGAPFALMGAALLRRGELRDRAGCPVRRAGAGEGQDELPKLPIVPPPSRSALAR